MKKLMGILSIFLVTACASNPDDIAARYVSPAKYSSYDCSQIVVEMDHISRKTSDLYQSLDTKHSNDVAQAALGVVIFWPALFLLEGGDGSEATEYANLKGEFEALRTSSVQQKCETSHIQSPEEILRDKAEEENKKSVPSSTGRKHI